MGKGKSLARRWIRGSNSDRRVSVVARRAIQQRLGAVLYFLPKACQQPEKVRFVHQLRIATRRSVAALDLFEDVLPARKAKQMRKLLRKLRRAAGDSREMDVMARRYADWESARKCKRTKKKIARQRKRAQRTLDTAFARLKRARFKRKVKRLIKSIAWRGVGPEPTFGAFAQQALSKSVDRFFEASRDLSDVQRLHKMRIGGKQLRYTMELCAGAFSRSFRTELYPALVEVQDKLGEINDHAVSQATLKRWIDKSKGKNALKRELKKLRSAEQSGLESKCEQFRSWWTPARAVELRSQFDRCLCL